METSTFVLLLVLMPVILGAWKLPMEERATARYSNRGLHHHAKRHMLPDKRHMLPDKQTEKRRPSPTPKVRDIRQKPSGHLTPLQDDDMNNDEVVSVAIGPPLVRPKYDRGGWKNQSSKRNSSKTINSSNYNNNAANFVKDVLTQLGREFLLHQVNENFVFGQYVGNAMKNLTNEIRLKMQHEILDLIVKYQKINMGDTNDTTTRTTEASVSKQTGIEDTGSQIKEITIDKKIINPFNETEEGWPDFSNLAKIVG